MRTSDLFTIGLTVSATLVIAAGLTWRAEPDPEPAPAARAEIVRIERTPAPGEPPLLPLEVAFPDAALAAAPPPRNPSPRRRRKRRTPKPTPEPARDLPQPGDAVQLEPSSVGPAPRPERWPSAPVALRPDEQRAWDRARRAAPIGEPTWDDQAPVPAMSRAIDRQAATWRAALDTLPAEERGPAEVLFTEALMQMTEIEAGLQSGDDPTAAFADLGQARDEALDALDEVLPDALVDRLSHEIARRR